MKITKRRNKEKYFDFSVKATILTAIILLLALTLCLLLMLVDKTAAYASMIFILAVFIISIITNGYFYGMVSSLISVLLVNYVFTYPYFEFNFTLSGYPVTILSMFAVSVVTSTLTTQIKRQKNIGIEVEREKTRSNLLRAVSHDLRTPLTSILGATSAVIDNNSVLTDEERLKLIGEVKEEAEWLIRMVENLLVITRIDGDNTSARITKELEAVEEVVADSVTKFKKRFPNRSISVKVPDELLMVPMDAVLIEQVIMNLLENSVIHAKGSDKSEFSVYKSDAGAVFVVADNGAGIHPDILPHIFDGYFNETYENDSDTKHNMGIGMSVCNTIIKAHNGTMTAENRPSGGAVFSFTLPMEE